MSAPAAAPLLKIGDVARRSGVGVESLRFYESRGLIAPAARTESGYRIYDSSIFDRLEFIKKAQLVGFTLDEISRIIDESSGGARPCAEVRKLAEAKLEALERRIAELERYRDELRETVEAWAKQRGKRGHVCGLIEGLDPQKMHPPKRGRL